MDDIDNLTENVNKLSRFFPTFLTLCISTAFQN